MDEQLSRLLNIFEERCGGVPDVVARAPGRVNLIGEHTDYNDGFVLPMAISCGTMVAARARADGLIRVFAADLDMRHSSFSVNAPIMTDTQETWSNYVRGVADSLQQQGLLFPGADLILSGTVPQGAGLSSSASLEIAVGLALAVLAGQPDYDRTQLALAGQRAESAYAGCNCGIMDQLVSARAQHGHAMLLDCRSLAISHAKLPEDCAIMIVHSGIDRGLVDGEYNSRRLQCEAAAQHYGVAALRDLNLESLENGKAGLDPVSFARARHVVSENSRTLAAAQALRAADLRELGVLMAQSHISMRDDFAITTPAIDDLVALLQTAIGNEGGARMTGGGFGGAVVAILPRSAIENVRENVLQHYRTPSGHSPLIMMETAQNGANTVIF